MHSPVRVLEVLEGDVGGAGVVASSDDDDALFASVRRHADDADSFD